MTEASLTVVGTPAPLSSDIEWALGLYGMFARGGDDERMFQAVIDGEPWSKSRPRFARRGGAYQPRDDRDAEERFAWHLRRAGAMPFSGNVMLACRFYRGNSQRIDGDNLLKHVCDSANGILWADDSQVTLVLADVQFDPERPRTVIIAGNHSSTLLRGDDRQRPCARCGKPYIPPAGRRRAQQRYCSPECSRADRVTVLADRTCEQCGKPFHPVTKTRTLCSPECRSARLTGRSRKRATAPMSQCSECGKELTHRRGGRCRDCWRASPGMYADPALQPGAIIRIREIGTS